MSDTKFIATESVGRALKNWRVKAMENVEKWGLQSFETIALAIDEEWGETVQAYHEATFEDADGNPLDEKQDLSECTDEQLDRIEEELHDTAALLIQLQADIDRARQA